MKIIFSNKCLEYSQVGHPESPERVKDAYEFLREKSFKFLKPEVAKEKDILKVHSKELVESVKSGNFFNPDSPGYENIFYYASLSAGGAIKAMNECLKNNEYSFSLMRPPGHHAGKSSLGGFCYFNNIAIAIAKSLEDKKIKKAAILDIDLHHGNGTQDIFLSNKNVIYASLHQFGFNFPFYPGTGKYSEKNCFNYPLPAGTKEKEYLEELEKALKRVREFEPDLVAVSAGFDTYEADNISGIELKIESYEKIAKLIKNLEKPTFSVLEGGYSSQLGGCIYSYLEGFE